MHEKKVLKNYGIVLFPAFQAFDVFGPLDALNTLSARKEINLYIIAATLDPVSTQRTDLPTASKFGESVVPTHTFSNAPPLDVLIVPGGLGALADTIGPVVDYIKRTYPTLQYLFTVCTGSWLAARAGVLDGKKATSNKQLWEGTKTAGPNVNWVAHARWVVDGNIWTTSGVSAGTDGMFGFIKEIYGEELASEVADALEYERHTDPSWDPFAEKLGLC